MTSPTGSFGIPTPNTNPPESASKEPPPGSSITNDQLGFFDSMQQDEIPSMVPELKELLYAQAGIVTGYVEAILESSGIIDWNGFNNLFLEKEFKDFDTIIRHIGPDAFNSKWIRSTGRLLHLGWYINQHPNDTGVVVWEPKSRMLLPQAFNKKKYISFTTRTRHAYFLDFNTAFVHSAATINASTSSQGRKLGSLVASLDEASFPATSRTPSVNGPGSTTTERAFESDVIGDTACADANHESSRSTSKQTPTSSSSPSGSNPSVKPSGKQSSNDPPYDSDSSDDSDDEDNDDYSGFDGSENSSFVDDLASSSDDSSSDDSSTVSGGGYCFEFDASSE